MMHEGPCEFTWRVTSVLWLNEPLVPVTCATYVPVEAVEVVVNSIGELAAPLGGGVTVWGTATLMPVGALPTHEVEKLTGELKLPKELITTLVDELRPGVTETVPEVGAISKSGTLTGARTAGVPLIATAIWVECVIAPFAAATTRV